MKSMGGKCGKDHTKSKRNLGDCQCMGIGEITNK